MRRSPADSTNRSLAAFGKLQHIRWNSAIIETSTGSFVVIGEPGRDVDGVDGANDGQAYAYQYTGP